MSGQEHLAVAGVVGNIMGIHSRFTALKRFDRLRSWGRPGRRAPAQWCGRLILAITCLASAPAGAWAQAYEATVDAPAATVRVANREVVVLRASVFRRTPAQRAIGAERLLIAMAEQGRPTAVSSRAFGPARLVTVGDQDAFALVVEDLDPAGTETLDDLVAATIPRLQQAMNEAVEARTPARLVRAAALALGGTFVAGLMLWLLRRAYRWLADRARQQAERQLRRLSVGKGLVEARISEVTTPLLTFVFAVLTLVLLYNWLTFVLRRFPYTRPWGETLRVFMTDRTMAIGAEIIASFPNLFTVLIIVVLTRVAVRASNLFFASVESGRTVVAWAYPETAQPTRRLVNALLWFFALALAYPFLPGSHTDAFRGVSVFVGLIISLGSSGIVNQVMSGFTLTYSRALRVGDFVRIGEVEGTVTEVGTLSTKLRSLRREEVTIPNAVVVATQTTNYSRFASEGVLAVTSVTIGYDTPWRQVEALLLQAAARTSGIRSSPEPIVRQMSLQDFYVEYTLFVAIERPETRVIVLGHLHANIQDAFNESGVQIMSPHYESDPESAKIVPRDRWHAAPTAGAAEGGPRREQSGEVRKGPDFERGP